MRVAVHGSGVAAAVCRHLLADAGLATGSEPSPPARVPAIMLGAPALALLRDVMGQPNLLAGMPRITRRVVAWGGLGPVSVPHAAIVVSEDDLRRALDRGKATAGDPRPADFAVHVAAPLPEGERLGFGKCEAEICRVALRDPALHEECRIEALDAGWLFLLPGGAASGWLLGFGAPLAELLAQSRLVAPVVELAAPPVGRIDTAPAMSVPLAGESWLACGSAALRFDPICGDGTAQAVREAVLAAAVVGGIAGGGERDALLLHYRSMLVAGMRRHLELCARFYADGGTGAWWAAQAKVLASGHETCTRMLARMPEPRFVLRGCALEPRLAAA